MEVELPLDPAGLVLEEDPEPALMHLEVLEVERHVPSVVRLTLPLEEQPVAEDGRAVSEEKSGVSR